MNKAGPIRARCGRQTVGQRGPGVVGVQRCPILDDVSFAIRAGPGQHDIGTNDFDFETFDAEGRNGCREKEGGCDECSVVNLLHIFVFPHATTDLRERPKLRKLDR